MSKWEYLWVRMDYINSDNFDVTYEKVRYVSWKEIPNWKKGPTVQEYFNQLGEQGWELVAIVSAIYWFKRPKS